MMVSSNVGLAFGNLLLKDSFIELLEVFKIVEIQAGKVGQKKTFVLSSLMLSWAISIVAFTFVFTFVLINHLGIDIFTGNQV